ncbi:MAG: MgtC/SapB family protein [Clostridia bacterium]|nr:MgtC/SapB family protein [Akkermansia sp.]MBQ5840755.1 MgtC/SapB family protein [Clostridia bacterium]
MWFEVNSLMQWYEAPLRIALAVLFGLIIGFERERRHRPAGVKTHVIVCVGAALISLIQIYMASEVIQLVEGNGELGDVLKTDLGRMGAQVVSGIGFLGAGTILKTKGSVRGLTTASTVWLIACVGLAVGMGYYYISGLTVGFIWLSLVLLKLVQRYAQNRNGIKKVDITFLHKSVGMAFVQEYCTSRNIVVRNIEFVAHAKETVDDVEGELLTYEYSLAIPRSMSPQTVLLNLQMGDGIVSAKEPEVL